MIKISTVAALALLIGAGSALAQAPAAAPAAKPAATAPATPATPKAAAAPRTQLSKDCSAQADTKGLHGKERKKFRSECKKGGGKSPA